MLNISLTNVAEMTTSLSILCGAGYAIYRFVKSNFGQPIFQFLRDLIDVVKTHKAIKQQILPNGGSSISDTVKRIEIRQCIADGMDRAILMKINAIMFESSVEGRCLAVSRAYCDFTGKQKEDILDNGWINCIVEEDRERVWEEWSTAVSQKREYIGQYKMIDHNGKKIPVTCRTFNVYNPKLEVIRYIGLVEKVDEKNI